MNALEIRAICAIGGFIAGAFYGRRIGAKVLGEARSEVQSLRSRFAAGLASLKSGCAASARDHFEKAAEHLEALAKKI